MDLWKIEIVVLRCWSLFREFQKMRIGAKQQVVFLALEDARVISVRQDQRLGEASCQSSQATGRSSREFLL